MVLQMTKDAVLHLRIEPDIKAAVEAAAKLDDRSVSSLVQKLIKEHCARVGTIKPAQ